MTPHQVERHVSPKTSDLKPAVTDNAEGWFVFSRASLAATYGLKKSKKSGIWWIRVDSERAAQQLRLLVGPSAWAASGVGLRQRKRRILYRQPSRQELIEREAERQQALGDFAVGIDSPPWADGPA
jgi:hypothetical protein